jgi:ABC-2 type transport system ATP-binding protein
MMLKVQPIESSISNAHREQGRSRGRRIAVEVRSLHKSYDQQLAVKDVSFSFRGGEVLGLLGPNGAGKSTIMMMITGLLAADSGEVILNGEKYDGRRLEQRRLFGVVPQEYALYQDLSAMNNLMFFGRLYGLRGRFLKSRCDEVLEQIGLTENANRQSANYSGGLKRRLNFGIALIHKPQILILDEPTLGVDTQSRFRLMECISQHTADGRSIEVGNSG